MIYKNKQYEAERALYNIKNCDVIDCNFEGPEDGESPLKECKNVNITSCMLNLRYPFWHNDYSTITDCIMKENCRAPLWYCNHIQITNTTCSGVKAVRECNQIKVNNSTFQSEEFGWKSNNLVLEKSNFSGNYFLFNSNNVIISDSSLNGKYSFQYMKNVKVKNCKLNTKDAFWHSNNVTIENSYLEGEYIAWYSKNLTFINCTIKGTQPFCYCKGLKLINCQLIDADFAFENSEVNATLKGKVISIKNPLKGKIIVDEVDDIIIQDYTKLPKGKIIVRNSQEN